MSKQKKTQQLGMNPSTASGRLVKDTLFRLAVEAGNSCFHCGEELTRDTFSIEHKEPWLDSENPSDKFFDQNNIAFSHLSCNSSAARRTRTVSEDHKKKVKAEAYSRYYTSEKRKERYERTGK